MRAGVVALVGVSVGGCHVARFQGPPPAATAVRTQLVVTRGARAVDAEVVRGGLERGLRETLGDGPPYGLTGAPDAPLLSVEVRDVNLAPARARRAGTLDMTLRVELYDPDGARLYHTQHSCEHPLGAPRDANPALYVANGIKQRPGQSPDAVAAQTAALAYACGADVVAQLRRQAGASPGWLGDALSEVGRQHWGESPRRGPSSPLSEERSLTRAPLR